MRLTMKDWNWCRTVKNQVNDEEMYESLGPEPHLRWRRWWSWGEDYRQGEIKEGATQQFIYIYINIYIYNQQFKQGGEKFCWHLSSSTSDSELEFPSCWGWGGVGGSGRTTTPADGGGGDAARRSQDTLLCNNSD
jgi:hypothetical protein